MSGETRVNAERITLRWVDLYTRGVAPALRTDRVAEIESDLWDHRAAAGPGIATELAIVSRCLRGVPADLGWRRARRHRRPLPTPLAVARFLGWSAGALSLAVLLAGHAWIASSLVGLDLFGTGEDPADIRAAGQASATILLTMLAALTHFRARPRLGAGLVSAAAIASVAIYWWMLVLYPAVPAVVVSAAVLARRQAQRRRRPPVRA